MKEFIVKNKTYIIIVIIAVLSVSSVVIENINSKNKVEINNEVLEKDKYENKICAYIAGEVANPGVYYIEEGSRVNTLVDIAGGFTKEADIQDINLAEIVNDSDKIDIPKIANDEYDNTFNEEEGSSSSIKININTASLDELQSLNGIGEATAKKIIEYRQNSKFEKIEDILNVSGIGSSKYELIKEYICIN